MLFSFGVGVAGERGLRFDALMRTTPLLTPVLLLAKIVAALLIAFLGLAVLFLFGGIVGGVHLNASAWSLLLLRLLLGSATFIAIGFAFGYLFGANSAVAVVNLVYLPMSLASGLLVPLPNLPSWVQQIAHYLPTYHFAQLAWGEIGVRTEAAWTAVAWLAGYAVVFLAIAAFAYRRDERSRFA
jgi:ABC-2 type transport system permease protein